MAQQCGEAVVVLATGGAAREVGSHARYSSVGVAARELKLDVAIEVFEALVAGQLRATRAEQPAEQIRGSTRSDVVHSVPPSRR
jgi:hypothetical protein